MANNEKAISELTTASEIKNSDNLEISQDTGGGLVSLKATILAIANKMLKGINFTSDLQTTDKTVIGAINEVAQGGGGGGSSTLEGLTDVDIDDLTLADGQTLVYDEIEEKWVNGQGGGGTGGHTIIDENGTSMTARAGLQFVGADVSDDGTNNKTIVDLASAGGIDGVFIDTENVIQAPVSITTTASYTATEDCCVRTKLWCSGNNASEILIDNLVVGTIYISGAVYYIHYLKKGQTISFSVSAQSEYTVYGIQTGTTHSKFQPVIYSTEEREIGVWTDGKPLYEKTIHTGALSTGGNNIAHNVSNIEHLISASGKFIYSTYENVFPFVSIGSSTWNVSFSGFNSTNIIIEVGSEYSYYPITDSYTTIRYTKTTDVAGSGTWTPQGVPTHHYSTDEKVIGTWIDGSTLYEKTFTTSNTTQNAEVNIDASSLNIDTCVYVGGIYTRKGTGYSFKYPFGQLDPNSSPQIGSFIRYGDINKNITYKIVLSTNESTDYQHITIQYTKSSS